MTQSDEPSTDEAESSGSEPSSKRPHGRDAVIASLVDAARQLFAEDGIDNVSVRSIAREANVNPGLIHRHFDSKTALVRATFAEDAERALHVMDSEDPVEATRQLFDFALDNPSFAKTLASVLLGSTQLVDVLPTEGPLRVYRDIMIDARGRQAIVDFLLVIATGLGWVVFAPALQALSDLDDTEFAAQRIKMRERLGSIVAAPFDEESATT